MGRAALAVLWVLAACARPELPPGGPEDRLPPIVVETRPDTFATVEAGIREFSFQFSERISERPTAGTLDNAVVVSPSVGNVRVQHGRQGIEVRTQEGLLPGQVYRVTVLPVLNDMFGNRLQDPFDLIVSTGGAFVPNVVAGVVEDRVTGRAVDGARVEALFTDGADTIRHWNYSDRDGIFSLRYVPTGRFQVRAWEDRNRDGEVNPGEPQTRFSLGQLPEPPDTSFSVLSLIEPDTSRAQLLNVVAVDSVTLRFEFDDHLDPSSPGSAIQASVTREGQDTSIGVSILQEHEYRARQAELADSASVAEAVEQVRADPTAVVARDESPTGLSGLRLPSQALMGILDSPLEAGAPYQTAVSRVINIAGAPLGGGTALVVWEPPQPDSAAADSLQVDTLQVDTLQVDTLQVDTLQVDTLGVDSLRADTARVDTLAVGLVLHGRGRVRK